ncbi:hypothetical protein [Tenacibaculum finnmarkense]|uniref:hypothetical protein n=1 Tax=Tenacibaculum finnmarkense TaxID=2781243 RepID=UPI001EFAFDAA|nr:hypothetical protein [Tenacibaculum finnmarkense]MCG8734626.1 hypothetical protein [Tenacibaculum finnmarkense]
MLNQIRTFRENQQKKPLYKTLTSMRSLAISIQSYNIFYGIKQAAFFYLLFEYLIPNDYLRVIPALFFGYFVAKAMLNIAVNIPEEKEWVIVSIAFFDFLMLCVIVDIMHKTDITEITNNLIFCGFVTYIGYWLNQVFVLKVEKTEKADTQKLIASLEQRLVAYEMQVTELEKNGTDADHGRPNTDHGQPNTDHGRPNTDHGQPSTDHGRPNTDQVKEGSQTDLLDSINNTCPHCKLVYPSKRSRDSHKGKCKLNPKNITK